MATKDLKEKIKNRLDQIEMLVRNDYHLKNPEEMMLQTLAVSKFWSVLSEEDRDFIQAVQSSIEEGWSWKELVEEFIIKLILKTVLTNS